MSWKEKKRGRDYWEVLGRIISEIMSQEMLEGLWPLFMDEPAREKGTELNKMKSRDVIGGATAEWIKGKKQGLENYNWVLEICFYEA